MLWTFSTHIFRKTLGECEFISLLKHVFNFFFSYILQWALDERIATILYCLSFNITGLLSKFPSHTFLTFPTQIRIIAKMSWMLHCFVGKVYLSSRAREIMSLGLNKLLCSHADSSGRIYLSHDAILLMHAGGNKYTSRYKKLTFNSRYLDNQEMNVLDSKDISFEL